MSTAKSKKKSEKSKEEPAIVEPKKTPSKRHNPTDIFTEEKIEKMYNAEEPISYINTILQEHFRKSTGKSNFDEEKLEAKAEFHVNNLVFLKNNFPNFDNEAISTLMNVLSVLIDFTPKKNISTTPKVSNEINIENNNTAENPDKSEDKSIEKIRSFEENSQEKIAEDNNNPDAKKSVHKTAPEVLEKEKNLEKIKITSLPTQDNNNIETIQNVLPTQMNLRVPTEQRINYNTINVNNVDFLELSKQKILEIKEALTQAELIPKTKGEFALANNKEKKRTEEGKFFLNGNEIEKIMSFIKTDFLPYIRMWLYFDKEHRKETHRKIEVLINDPMPMLPLNLATMEEEKKELINEEEERKKKEEEELKKKEEEEAKLKEEEELKKKLEEEKLTQEETKEKTYLDLLDKLGFNEETKKIIIQKVEELNKDVEAKIEDRKKTLDEKIKEIDASKGGKKK